MNRLRDRNQQAPLLSPSVIIDALDISKIEKARALLDTPPLSTSEVSRLCVPYGDIEHIILNESGSNIPRVAVETDWTEANSIFRAFRMGAAFSVLILEGRGI